MYVTAHSLWFSLFKSWIHISFFSPFSFLFEGSQINLPLSLLAVAISQACHAKRQNATCWSFINPREKTRLKSSFLDKLPWAFLSKLFADDIITHKNWFSFSATILRYNDLFPRENWRKKSVSSFSAIPHEEQTFSFCCFCNLHGLVSE